MSRDRIIQLRNRPLNGPVEDRRALGSVITARQENFRPIRHEYEDPSWGQKRPDDIVVLD